MASKNISFETIPSSIRVPGRYIEFNTKLAMRNLPVNPQLVLIVAPMTTSLNAAYEPLKAVEVFSDTEAGELFGFGSWAHLMTRQAIRNNRYINLSVIGVPDDEAALKAAGDITFSGAVGKSGQVIVTIGLKQYKIAASMNEPLDSLVDRMITVINADPDCLVVASKVTDKLVVTAKNAGEIGNEIYLDAATGAKDLIVAATKMQDGVGNADVAIALSRVAGKHYQVYISAFSDDNNLQVFSEHITNVSGAIEKRGGIVVAGWRDSLAKGTTQAKKLNDGRISIAWYKGSISPNALIAAGYGAVIAFEEDPARPLNTLEVKGLDITPEAEWPLFTECNNSLYNGLTPLTVVNNNVQIMRAISTYTKNAANTDDPSLLDITTIRTLDYTLKSIDQRIGLRFPREKLSSKTPPKVRSEILDVLMKLEDLEILEEVIANKEMLIVERDDQDVNRLNAAIPADVVNGLHVFAGRIDLLL